MARTPGPWAVDSDADVVVDANGHPVADCGYIARPGDESAANALLIAAVDNLLAALKSAREVVEEHTTELLRSFCVMKNGEPDRDSMDDNERQSVAELESVIAEIDAALAGAEPR